MPDETAARSGRGARVLKNLRLGLALAWAASPGALTRYTVLGVIASAMPAISVSLGAELVNAIAAAQVRPVEFQSLLPIILGLWVTTTLQRGIHAYTAHGRTLFIRQVQLEAERRLLEKAASLDIGHFDNSDWHDRLSRAKRDVSWRPGDLTWSLLGLSGNLVAVTLMATILIKLHYMLVLLAFAAPLASLALERRVTRRLYEFTRQETPEEREREYLAELLVQPRMTKEIRAYGLAGYLLGRYKQLADTLLAMRERVYTSARRMSILTGLLTGAALVLAYLFVAVEGVAGRIDPGGVTLVIAAFGAVSNTLATISTTFVAVDQHTTFLTDYFAFLAVEPLLPAPVPPHPDATWRIDDIEFERVTATYRDCANPAISNFNLHIRKGELIALVGDNGAGKTTLIKLLLRFYDVNSGAVRVGGVDVRQIDPAVLRSRIGVLFQDYGTYELTVRENIIMGRPEAVVSDARVLQALHDARGDWLLKKLPRGLDSHVGRLFRGAQDLSGGEWQRLALARLMYRDADVWILDEPTAALDPEAEAAVFTELKENLRGRIGIIISHRFSTARIADRIAVVARGRVIELGTHRELMIKGGRYAELFELQAAAYR